MIIIKHFLIMDYQVLHRKLIHLYFYIYVIERIQVKMKMIGNRLMLPNCKF